MGWSNDERTLLWGTSGFVGGMKGTATSGKSINDGISFLEIDG